MQGELAAERPDLDIRLLAVNEAGHEGGNDLLFGEGALPVLQDDATAAVWASWGAEWRDVIVVDPTNEAVLTYNLTTYSLADPAHYSRLKELLVAVAEGRAVEAPDSGTPE